jgi:hypothetical protein
MKTDRSSLGNEDRPSSAAIPLKSQIDSLCQFAQKRIDEVTIL